MNSDFIVVSYGTANGYWRFADRLETGCIRVGLKHDIQHLPSTPRPKAYLMKPRFIRSRLDNLGTIVWMDADTTVLRPFTLPDGNWDVGLIPNTTAKSRNKNPTSSFVLAFRPTDGARTLLGIWAYLCDWPELSIKRQDHKRLTWAREISEGRHTEIDLSDCLRGCLIRDVGTQKEAAT